MDLHERAHYEPSHLDLVFANSAIAVFGPLLVKCV